MPLFSPSDRRFAEVIGRLSTCNPFLAERIECERAALGDAFDDRQADWNLFPELPDDHPNVRLLLARSKTVLDAARERLVAARNRTQRDEEARLYENLLLFVLYHRYRRELDVLVRSERETASAGKRVALYRTFAAAAEHYLAAAEHASPLVAQLPHVFAGFFQIRRAFDNVFHFLIGVSKPTARLRADVWRSIFTHDLDRYRRVLFDRMGDFTTLVAGPSGTGKELVARAIALSRYIPFDAASERFAAPFAGGFHAINLSALSPTLVESELFGHRHGAFTGATADRAGYLEQCTELGAVFLDEIGELDTAIQVKLLRVLQTREFQRLGDTEPRAFRGKIIAATNRDVAAEMRAGRFREDFYYRICSDIIVAPALADRIADDPRELRQLLVHIAERLVGQEAPQVADEVEHWIAENLGAAYPWPGNVRELEQCVRNVLVRKSYAPPKPEPLASDPADAADRLAAAMRAGKLSVDELVREYCRIVYAQTKSYEATARRIGLDRRTVRTKLASDPLP